MPGERCFILRTENKVRNKTVFTFSKVCAERYSKLFRMNQAPTKENPEFCFSLRSCFSAFVVYMRHTQMSKKKKCGV